MLWKYSCFHHLNCLCIIFIVKKSVKSVATHSRSHFAVAILVRHTDIQSPNSSHARTHSINSEDQGAVGFFSECTVHIKQSRLQPCFLQFARRIAVLFPLNKKTDSVTFTCCTLRVIFKCALPSCNTVTEEKWGFVPHLIVNVTKWHHSVSRNHLADFLKSGHQKVVLYQYTCWWATCVFPVGFTLQSWAYLLVLWII